MTPTPPAAPSPLIARLETLRKPPVHGSQQFARLRHLALVAPEACEAHGGAEFQGLSLVESQHNELPQLISDNR